MFVFIENNFLQHLGYLFTFLALTIRDVFWLRITLAIAQILLGVYQISIHRYDVVIWNGVFTVVNFYHIVRIMKDRKPVYIPNELQDFYKNIHTRPAWRLMNHLKPYSQCQCSELQNAEYFSNRLVNLPSSVVV